MAVVLARVDDRLVHGQIVEAWVPYVRADALVVVGEELCRDEERCRLMRFIVPDRLAFKALSVSQLAGYLEGSPSSRVLLLFGSLGDALRAVEAGTDIPRVNVGNLHHRRGGTMVTPSVFLDAEDKRAIRELCRLGVAVEAREVPEGRGRDLAELAGCAGEGR